MRLNLYPTVALSLALASCRPGGETGGTTRTGPAPPAPSPAAEAGSDVESDHAPRGPDRQDGERRVAPRADAGPGSPGAPEDPPPDLEFVDLRVGDGAEPRTGDDVVVRWRGSLLDGSPLTVGGDEGAGETSSFRLGVDAVIRGLAAGVRTMKVGGRRRLTVPAALGYGQRGVRDEGGKGFRIPPGASLILVVELLEVRRRPDRETSEGDSRG